MNYSSSRAYLIPLTFVGQLVESIVGYLALFLGFDLAEKRLITEPEDVPEEIKSKFKQDCIDRSVGMVNDVFPDYVI